jgi:ferrochelatase
MSPPYIDGLADSVAASCEDLEPRAGVLPHVIFSAHSLPKAAVPVGDPYEQQLRETAGLVAAKLELPEGGWTVAYQSVSGPAQDWLGPSVEEAIVELSERGVEQAVLCPFGFVADQVEILYDLDVVVMQKAQEVGVTVARTQLLNDSSALIDSLGLLVEEWRYERAA